MEDLNIKKDINILIKKSNIEFVNNKCIINVSEEDYRSLNETIRTLLKEKKKSKNSILNSDLASLPDFELIEINNVLGQRYIGDGLQSGIKININGVPGNDLAAFMKGPFIEVFGNVQDGPGNTMDSGKIVIHGNAGDITGYSMRGGEIYVKNNVGYRSGIHMKSYFDKFPVIVIGGKAGNFLGEYMAGGIIIVLGINFSDDSLGRNKNNFFILSDDEPVGNFVGTGMHGGKIFVRGNISDYKLGKEIIKSELDEEDKAIITKYLNEYYKFFGNITEKINVNDFTKLAPYSKRPYGKLYAY